MNIHIYNNARSFTVCYWNDDSEWEDACPYSTIDAAVEAARNEIDVRQQALGAHIIDAETGEIYVTCTWDENDIPEEDYGPQDIEWDDHYWDDGCPIEDAGYLGEDGYALDDVDESNYDPYAGCDMYEVEPLDYGY